MNTEIPIMSESMYAWLDKQLEEDPTQLCNLYEEVVILLFKLSLWERRFMREGKEDLAHFTHEARKLVSSAETHLSDGGVYKVTTAADSEIRNAYRNHS